MLRIYVENIVDIAIIQCEGRIVRSEEAFELRKAVIAQSDSRIVVLDLSEVRTIADGGLGMLLFLQRWTQWRGLRLTLFNPRNLVRYNLERANPTPEFDFLTLNEMMALIARPDKRYAAAA